jgi:hypothetical protein
MNINVKINAKEQAKKSLHLDEKVGIIQHISKRHSVKFYHLILNFKTR